MFFKKPFIYKTIVPVVLVLSILALLSGEDWLLYRVNILFGFHLGTIIGWIGLIACSLISLKLNRNYKKLRFVSSFSFYISIFWLIITYLLADKHNLIFVDKMSFSFIAWIIISGFPLLIFAISIISHLSMRISEYRSRKN